MNEKFKIGIIGCGKISGRHVEGCLLSPNVELTGLVDPVLERADALARGYGITPRVSDNLADLIDHVDGVVIAAPNNLHRPLALQCAESGTHVLIEKPIAGTSADGLAICEAHERAGTICTVGFVTRFRDNNRNMRELIQNQYFGETIEFAYQFGSRGGWAPLSAYNLDKSATGGGVLVVTGSHFLDRMLHWFGDPSEQTLFDDSLGGPEANALATFRFANHGLNVCGSARFSKTVALPAGIVVKTEQGMVFLADAPNAPIRFRPHNESIELHVSLETETENVFQAQIEDFAAACRGEHAPAVSGREGLRSVLLTEKLYQKRFPLADSVKRASLHTIEDGVHE
ncbi:MAG: Gfo/Idh/MocA family oxidoreductase [Rubripirellula sp.]|nr:Gfo/Idh/MocA family oxidoreductase [Rubripirellula sp.]